MFKTCGAICEKFVQAHFLKASFHRHLRKLARSNQYFLKLDLPQWAKGYHFEEKFSKYFFHFTLEQKISQVIILS